LKIDECRSGSLRGRFHLRASVTAGLTAALKARQSL
jgi:hypothetical protein